VRREALSAVPAVVGAGCYFLDRLSIVDLPGLPTDYSFGGFGIALLVYLVAHFRRKAPVNV
jgi:hypothetical protein